MDNLRLASQTFVESVPRQNRQSHEKLYRRPQTPIMYPLKVPAVEEIKAGLITSGAILYMPLLSAYECGLTVNDIVQPTLLSQQFHYSVLPLF